MEKIKDVKEEIRNDVNEYMRQAEKLDGNKSFKKTYVMDEDVSFMLELNGSEMKMFMLFNGITLEKTTIGDMSNFDSAWDSFIQETGRFTNKMLEGYRDSFNEKMDEFIELDELFEPFTVKNKEDHSLDFEIDLKTQIGFDNFARLFEYFNGIGLDALCDDFIAPHIDVIDYSLFELDNVGLKKKVIRERHLHSFLPQDLGVSLYSLRWICGYTKKRRAK